MKNADKTNAQLLEEVAALHQQVAELTAAESERRQVEGVLRRSEEYFRLLIENASDVILVLNSDGTVRYQSPSAERVLGYKPEDAIGKSGFEFIHPDDLPNVTNAFADAIKSPGATLSIEMRARHRDGSWRMLEAIGNNLLNNPVVAGVIINTRDITERKRVEEALRASEERYRELFENASDIVYTHDLAGQITSVNNAGKQVTGYTHEELLSFNIAQLVAPDYLARAGKMIEQKLAGAGTTEYELEIVAKDGHRVPLEVSFRLIYKDGKPIAAQGIARDITERKRAEEELIRLSSAVRMSTDSIVVSDLEGKIVDVNEATLKMYGTADKGDLTGKSAFDLIVPDDRAKAFAGREETLKKGFLRTRDYQVIIKDGSTIPVEMSVALMQDAGGNPVGFVAVSRDITEHKRLEEALRQSKENAEAANRTKSEFLAAMSHELRSPLTVILGYTSLLLEQTFGSLREEQADTLRRIDRNAQELFDLITTVLDLSRLEAGRLPLEVREVQVPELLEELKAETQGVRERTSLEFVWQVEGELPPLQTDPGKVKVVVKNLIGNAVKFTKAGSITVVAHNHDGGVEISVTDTGVGISQEALELIFEPFHQVDNSGQLGGTGLGLHIVKRLLELLGGTVTVESEVGRGSTFRVWVPKVLHTP